MSQESEQAQEAWRKHYEDYYAADDYDCDVHQRDIAAVNAIVDYKAAIKAEIEKQREGTYWLGESKEKALDMFLSLLDTVTPIK